MIADVFWAAGGVAHADIVATANSHYILAYAVSEETDEPLVKNCRSKFRIDSRHANLRGFVNERDCPTL